MTTDTTQHNTQSNEKEKQRKTAETRANCEQRRSNKCYELASSRDNMNVQALLSICASCLYIIHATCLMSAGSDCALKVTMCRVCELLLLPLDIGLAVFSLLLLFCFYFQCTYKCMSGWMECEWEVKQVLYFGVVAWLVGAKEKRDEKRYGCKLTRAHVFV